MSTRKRPAIRYAGATVCLCLLALVGTWLPWVENTPQYLNGEPYVTAIGLAGMRSGFGSTFDLLVLVALVPAIGGGLVLQRWNWLRDACTCLSGLLLCWWVGGLAYEYWTVDHYLIKPGLGIVLVSGISLCILGAGATANRLLSRRTGARRTD